MAEYRAVQRTSELDRILGLPVRQSSSEDLCDALTEHLRLKGNHVCRPPGTRGPNDRGCAQGFTRFNAFQAQVLVELFDNSRQGHGAFVQGPPGVGKTGITIMAEQLLQTGKYLLVIPGSEVVREKTMLDIAAMREHWQVPNFLIESYERLRTEDYATFLTDMKFGMVGLDECHKAKDPRKSMGARLARMRKHGDKAIGFAMSGTPAKRSCLDFFHLIKWCMGEHAPVPLEESDQVDWAEYLDGGDSISVGCLRTFGGPGLAEVRRGYAKRIFSTPGCISSQERAVEAQLTVHVRHVPLTPEEDHWFKVLVGDPNDDKNFPGWTTPDGHTFTDVTQMWARQQQLALGFYYRWDPQPPSAWRKARYEWHHNVREILAHSDHLDTVARVATAVDAGEYPHLVDILETWRALEPTFKECKTWRCQKVHKEVRGGVEHVLYHNIPHWVGDTSLQHAAAWLEGGGIVWTVHRAFGYRLAEITGRPYFGEGGQSDSGESLNTTTEPGVIASAQACGEGLNLQRYHRQLIASIWPTNNMVEQATARSHRQGQDKDVEVEWAISCLGQLKNFERAAYNDAVFHHDMLTMPTRLCYGRVLRDAMPSDTWPVTGWAWRDYGERGD